MNTWKKLSPAEQEERINTALAGNIDFRHRTSLGIPASQLDEKVFDEHATFLKDTPLLRSYVRNPNHIGCHTTGESEEFFSGTQQLECEAIEILACDLLEAPQHTCDGYITSGGTEANIQAIWIYRNYFMHQHGASAAEIAIVASADTHYSIAKAANLLQLQRLSVPVHSSTRTIDTNALRHLLAEARQQGIRYAIVIVNMGTTMFGSIDDPALYSSCLEEYNIPFQMHADAAFGGFIYPVSHPGNPLTFANPLISSIALDAHKMLQAPYGTGIFLVRKGLIHHVCTEEASYVNGMDLTLCGSRSGANAIAVWMILTAYGGYGWLEKINKLLYRTDWCCAALDKRNIRYFRQPGMNIITIPAEDIAPSLAEKYGLVPDTHQGTPQWYKIVVMDHVTMELLSAFISDLEVVDTPA